MKEIEPGQEWANDRQMARHCGITIPTLIAWDNDETLAFPAARWVGRKKFRNLKEFDAWLRARTVRRVRREKPVTEEVAAI
jgi:hypothetical protein